MAIRCVWIEPAGRGKLRLRRFQFGDNCAGSFHNASVTVEELVPAPRDEAGFLRYGDYGITHDDPRWPTTCEKCGTYAFTAEDEWQVNVDEEWVDLAGKTVCWGLHSAPPGSLWDARWMPDGWVGDDGIKLTVQLPDSTPWLVDGPTSDCTKKGSGQPHDTRTGHHCWTRTGQPQAVPPTVTASPSILTPHYHGWLREGQLVEA